LDESHGHPVITGPYRWEENLKELEARTAIVTGGGGSIGSAICEALDAEGAVTYVVDLRAGAAEAVAQNLTRGIPVSMDVTDSGAWSELIIKAKRETGSVDILVNNAATHLQSLVEDTSDAQWDHVIRTNAYSAFFGCRAAIPDMQRQGKGAIVNVVTGQFGVAYSSAYTSSKFLVQGFTLCMALEVARAGIRVNTVAPGVVPDTGFERFYREKAELLRMPYDEFMRSALAAIPLGRFGVPADIAQAVLYLVSDRSAYVTGHLLEVTGGFAGYATSVAAMEA
jgi:NAD(P)-dependent dehydrogenase (short-subunit alcohol dehydrogenase family)